MRSVSVVVPVYNAARDLPQCLSALDSQTGVELQVVLVDDGSTDDSPRVLKTYAATHPNAVVLTQANGGAAAARNTGLDAATGDYVAFWDADDFAAPHTLRTLVALCEENACDIAQCGMKLIPKDATTCAFDENAGDAQAAEILTGTEAIARIYGDAYIDMVVLWNKIYRRSLWTGLRIPTGRICEDEAIVHEVFYRAARVAVTPAALYAYRQSDSSVMRTKGSLKRLDILWALKRRGEFLREKGLDDLATLNEKVLLTQYLHCANYVRDACEDTPDNRRRYRELVAAYRAARRALPAGSCSWKQRVEYAVYALCPRSEKFLMKWLQAARRLRARVSRKTPP